MVVGLRVLVQVQEGCLAAIPCQHCLRAWQHQVRCRRCAGATCTSGVSEAMLWGFVGEQIFALRTFWLVEGGLAVSRSKKAQAPGATTVLQLFSQRACLTQCWRLLCILRIRKKQLELLSLHAVG